MLSQDIAAEAAVWVARLHGPDRSPRMERDCVEWQSRSPAHRIAFERCTEVWQQVPGVGLQDAFASRPTPSPTRISAPHPRRRWLIATPLAAAALAAGLALHTFGSGHSFSTAIGEQRLVVLDDGTRVTLNTATRLETRLTNTLRTVSITTGEALFEVAKDAHRPFVVEVAGSQVVALGTTFSIRYTPDPVHPDASVTLIEGQVRVHPAKDGNRTGRSEGEFLLHPGERARLPATDGLARDPHPAQPPQVDHPRIDQLVAWQRGEALFDNTPLTQAIAEMNRYSRMPIAIGADSATGNLRVSGLFRTGDTLAFAHAVAKLHGLTVQERNDRIELGGPSRGS